ncbi:MAG: MFS transporter [Opitutus sp.]
MLFPTKKRDPELYPYRHGLYFAFFHALNWQVAIGTPTVLFMQQLGANSFEVGLVFSWTFLLTPVQVLATAFLPRLGYKRLTMAGWSLRGWCLLVPILLAVLAPTNPVPWMIYAMVTATFIYSLVRAVGTSTVTTWFYQLIPESIRGRYWATDQMTSGVAIVGSLLLYALLFTVLPLYSAFIILYSIAVAGAWVAYRQLKVLPDVEKPKLISLEKIVSETPRLMTEPSVFRTYLWMSVPLFAAITPISPFVAYYLKTSAGLTSADVILLTMLTYFGLITANWVMRSQMDRRGAKPFFRLSYFFHGVIALGWIAFLSTNGRWVILLPVLYFIQGIASGCWTSANLSYLAKIIPEQNRALPVSIHGAVITFIGGCTPVLWGLFLKVPGELPAVNVVVFEIFFVSLLLVCIVLTVLLRKLPEKAGAGSPLPYGSWALRPFRAVANAINLVEKPEAPKAASAPEKS